MQIFRFKIKFWKNFRCTVCRKIQRLINRVDLPGASALTGRRPAETFRTNAPSHANFTPPPRNYRPGAVNRNINRNRTNRNRQRVNQLQNQPYPLYNK